MEYIAGLPGFFKPVLHTGRRRSPHQHFRDRICLAALRAFTGAELYHAKRGQLTLSECALRVGSNVHYVRAAVVLLEHGDQVLIDRVLRGEVSILAAAASVEVLVKLLTAFKTATPKTRTEFFAATGCTNDLGLLLAAASPAERTEGAVRFGDAEAIWDQMVMPLVKAAE